MEVAKSPGTCGQLEPVDGKKRRFQENKLIAQRNNENNLMSEIKNPEFTCSHTLEMY